MVDNETRIQKEILDWLTARHYLVWRNSNIPTRHRRNLVHQPSGMPDIFFVFKGILFGIEVKTPTGKLSRQQRDWGDKLVINGGHYFVVTSLVQLIEALVANFGDTLPI